MKKKYLVKSTSTATDENPNFKGEVHVYYYGKGDTLCGASEITGLFPLCSYMIEEYGYSRACDAKRCWSFNNPQNDKFWKTEVEIVELGI